MTVSLLSVVPEPSSGTAPCPEPNPDLLALFTPTSSLYRHALARAAREDFPDWLDHVRPAAQCARPIRLSGAMTTVEAATGRLLSSLDTAGMPDGVIYKRCGNRRAGVCPACSKLYQRDAYQIIRAGIVGGKSVPETVARHPAIFTTLTAPSFGPVHNRVVTRHTCGNRRACDCRAEPCHARRDTPVCEHGVPQFCFARHERTDRRIGTPICADCYDYDAHAVWNTFAGQLWRRTKQAIDREISKTCRAKGIPRVIVAFHPGTGRPTTKPAAHTSCGKAAEFQMRAVVHFHALVRLDGRDPDDPDAIVPPPAGLTTEDLDQAIKTAAQSISFRTPPHPDAPDGWAIGWGEQIYNRPITLSGNGEVTDGMVAGYLAKYATKSTEVTGHTSARITDDTIGQYADVTGSHVQRLIAACWRIGRPHTTELIQLAYARLLGVIGTTGLELGRLDPDDPGAHVPALDRLHNTIGQLLDVAEAAPRPLHRPGRHIPTTGAVPAWACPACGSLNRTTVCHRCLAPRYERARAQQRLLFLLLLLGEVEADQPEANPYAGLRRWAHMLGFGGHFFTQSPRYSVRFRILREARITFRRNETAAPAEDDADADRDGQETVLVINSLTFAGVGWHTSADAMLANTASALAREHQQLARHLQSTLAR